ncbi:MAG: hypothetical protein ACK5KT_13085 [Dysgonomonas sp.]
MRNGLAPILLTLIILAIGFAVWFEGRSHGWFLRKAAEDVVICGNEKKDTLNIKWKYSGYNITSISTSRHNDDILHVDVGISRGYTSDKVTLEIDTVNIRRIEMYGKMYDLKDIPICD